MNSVSVRAPEPRDESAWRRLWAGYNAFYQASVPEEVTAFTWARALDPAVPLFGRLAERNGDVIGMALCVLHPGTWNLKPLCYLEDLFVDPAARGSGAGRALLTHLVDLGRAEGWAELYWHTRDSNAAARQLYDQFTRADDHVRYRLKLKPGAQEQN